MSWSAPLKTDRGSQTWFFSLVKTSLSADMHDLNIMTDFTTLASVNAENNGLKTISVVIMQQQGGCNVVITMVMPVVCWPHNMRKFLFFHSSLHVDSVR